MLSTSPPASLADRFGKLLSHAFLLTVILTMALAGWIALMEGMGRFTLPFRMDNASDHVSSQAQAVRARPSEEGLKVTSQELWALARLTSAERMTESKLLEQSIYYATMPRAKQVLMLVHVLFGVFCLSLGGLQFWPGFRKRFMKLHRIIGTVYITTVPISVVSVLIYMGVTAPHHIYDHLVAWISLWVFGVLALIAITMAMVALKARRIFEHQSWMALSFGCLLVAPLLRLDWVLLAWLFPAIDQETLNRVTMGVMLPQTLLIAYGLILVNRQYVRPMTKRQPAPLAGQGVKLFLRNRPLFLGAALVLMLVNVGFYIAGHGLSSLAAASTLVPAALLEHERAVMDTYAGVAAVFAVSISLAFPAALLALRRLLTAASGHASALQSPLNLATASLSLCAGLTAIWLGWHIGLAPQNALLSGGTMYTVNGVVLSGFSVLLLGAKLRGQGALMKESLVFLLCLLPFPTLFFLASQCLSWVHLPADYLAAGQGYLLPVGFSGVLLFVAMLHVVYGQATREHN